MVQRVTDSFGLAASIWNGDKFLMEAATSGGSRQIKVTAEVVGAYLSGGSGGGTPGTVIAETIPIEEIDALTAQEQSARLGGAPVVSSSAVSSPVVVQRVGVPTAPVAVVARSAGCVAGKPQAAVVEDLTKRRVVLTDLTKRRVVLTDLTKRAARVKDLVRHAAAVMEITRAAMICHPKARVVVVG